MTIDLRKLPEGQVPCITNIDGRYGPSSERARVVFPDAFNVQDHATRWETPFGYTVQF